MALSPPPTVRRCGGKLQRHREEYAAKGNFAYIKVYRRKDSLQPEHDGPYQLLTTRTAVKCLRCPTWIHVNHCKSARGVHSSPPDNTALEELANATADTPKDVYSELIALLTVAMQNRLALDYLLAAQRGTRAVIGSECCIYIPENTSVPWLITSVTSMPSCMTTAHQRRGWLTS
ncbi:hypothetical protein GN956_G10343 [Arapaima gigas]